MFVELNYWYLDIIFLYHLQMYFYVVIIIIQS